MSVTLRPFIRRIHRSRLSLIIVVALAACGGGGAEESTPTVVVTPAAGGMVMPTATALPMPTATATEAVVRFIPGQLFVAVDTVRLYADANRQAVVMNQYSASSLFTLLEPSGDYLTYPVTAEGADWLRLRADDGLVGWLPANELTLNE